MCPGGQQVDREPAVCHHFCGPPLDAFQQVHIFPVLSTPHLDAVLHVRSHHCRLEGQDHLPHPTDITSFDVAQDNIGFLGCDVTLLAHVHAGSFTIPRSLLAGLWSILLSPSLY